MHIFNHIYKYHVYLCSSSLCIWISWLDTAYSLHWSHQAWTLRDPLQPQRGSICGFIQARMLPCPAGKKCILTKASPQFLPLSFQQNLCGFSTDTLAPARALSFQSEIQSRSFCQYLVVQDKGQSTDRSLVSSLCMGVSLSLEESIHITNQIEDIHEYPWKLHWVCVQIQWPV